MSQNISKCRLCSENTLTCMLELGNFSFTGIFPKSMTDPVPVGSMSVVRCDTCGLVQLEQQFNLNVLYGDTYGYRSGLNKSMVAHLADIVKKCQSLVTLQDCDVVLDIGSNDGTLLNSYSSLELQKYGIDPLSKKFKKYYNSDVHTVPEFFNKQTYIDNVGNKKAKIVTSVSMFYDLPNPLQFASDVRDVLAEDGVWLTEQSYLPSMISTNSYDTICQEHLEYYCLKQLYYIANRVDLKIIDLTFNDTNGGSFQVIFAHKASTKYTEYTQAINKVLESESRDGYDTDAPFVSLKTNMELQKQRLLTFLTDCKKDSKLVYGYGASTKGNVLLQYCGINTDLLPKVAEVNEDKFGSYTPGTLIPIVNEKLAREDKPEYFLVLPWHFKDNIVKKETEFLNSGGKLVFPLPEFHIVSSQI